MAVVGLFQWYFQVHFENKNYSTFGIMIKCWQCPVWNCFTLTILLDKLLNSFVQYLNVHIWLEAFFIKSIFMSYSTKLIQAWLTTKVVFVWVKKNVHKINPHSRCQFRQRSQWPMNTVFQNKTTIYAIESLKRWNVMFSK